MEYLGEGGAGLERVNDDEIPDIVYAACHAGLSNSVTYFIISMMINCFAHPETTYQVDFTGFNRSYVITSVS